MMILWPSFTTMVISAKIHLKTVSFSGNAKVSDTWPKAYSKISNPWKFKSYLLFYYFLMFTFNHIFMWDLVLTVNEILELILEHRNKCVRKVKLNTSQGYKLICI